MGVKRVDIKKGEKEVKPWWGLGFVKRKVPIYETHWQKSSNHSMFNQVFSPHDYEGKTYEEKRENALEDAKNNLKFYKELIVKRVLPENTKVKVKKVRHTDAYHLEFWMPSVSELGNVGYEVDNQGRSVFVRTKRVKKIENEMEIKRKEIEKVAEEFGYNGSLGEDVYAIRNYGYDSKGELRLHDVHLLGDRLPNSHRKYSQGRSWYDPVMHEHRKKQKSLEKRLSLFFIALISLSIFPVLTNKTNITGNAIGNGRIIDSTISLFISIFLAVILFLLLKKIRKS